jgi:hypothetical protein
MKAAVAIAALTVAMLASPSAAGPQEDAVKRVIDAVRHGDDLRTAFPGATAAGEIAWLQRLAGCTANNLMRQSKGHYTVVWYCGSTLARGMEVVLANGRVASITTMEVFRRPNFEVR